MHRLFTIYFIVHVHKSRSSVANSDTHVNILVGVFEWPRLMQTIDYGFFGWVRLYDVCSVFAILYNRKCHVG